ncbi:MAG: TonB family protein [Planctomycetales bacterium]|nr:TonB family protein [Planctomycetales bacterium]
MSTRPSAAASPVMPPALLVSAMVHVGVLGALAAWQRAAFEVDSARSSGSRATRIVLVLEAATPTVDGLEAMRFEPPVFVEAEQAELRQPTWFDATDADPPRPEATETESRVDQDMRTWLAYSSSELKPRATTIARQAASAAEVSTDGDRLLAAWQGEANGSEFGEQAEVPRFAVPKVERAELIDLPRFATVLAQSARPVERSLKPRPVLTEAVVVVARPPRPDQRATEAFVRYTRTPPPTPGRTVSPTTSRGTGSLTPPDFRGNVPPAYPAEARQRGFEGTVLLHLSIDRLGRVVRVEVAETSGYAILDYAAIEAVRHWAGRPAFQNGQAIAADWNLPVRFRLN